MARVCLFKGGHTILDGKYGIIYYVNKHIWIQDQSWYCPGL